MPLLDRVGSYNILPWPGDGQPHPETARSGWSIPLHEQGQHALSANAARQMLRSDKKPGNPPQPPWELSAVVSDTNPITWQFPDRGGRSAPPPAPVKLFQL